ncbi:MULTISPECIES: formate dehydrogenase subunit delta [Methylomicrobium]|uniref:NADH-dependent formate dehydrogenase delta subunit FdsD n=1 Tax=Methylomicrobium album BG8 TaxID=686340 RepID=H8GKR2_METAL|nr:MULTISPECIES: formate dehydrogenase subunit delta [Methylomicrobium]EIC29234.1 NADH-dependent formate dehydrogenase delta subunit FdsD [Methylomicrobium album BG8]
MQLEKLIKMANDISDFFNSESDKELAAEGIKNHIKRSWDPRMRNQIIAYCQEDGKDLNALAQKAVQKLAS